MDSHTWTDPVIQTEQKAGLDPGKHRPFLAITLTSQEEREEVAAREILRLAGFKETLEQVALAAGCLPTQFADAFGHVLESVAGLKAKKDRLAQREADLQGAIDTLEKQLFATQQEREAYKTALVQAEHREHCWKESATKVGEALRSAELRANEALSVLGVKQPKFAETVQVLAAETEKSAARIAEQEARTVALERENRAYCLELAEKAEEIRSLGERLRLGDALVSILSNHCGESGDSEGAEDTLRRIIRERDERGGPLPNPDVWVRKDRFDALQADRDITEKARIGALHAYHIMTIERDKALAALRSTRANFDALAASGDSRRIATLEATIEDGIAHVEQARTLLDRFGADWHAKTMDELDLAHEVLSGAVAGVGGHDGRLLRLSERTDAINASSLAEVRGRLVRLEIFRGAVEGRTTDTENHLADLQRRVIALESDLGKLGAATNPAGKPPAYARLESLEESRGYHAVMLTDHADRLWAVEQALRVDGETNLTWHPFFRNGIARLEKLVSRVVEDLEGLKARISAGNNATEQGKE